MLQSSGKKALKYSSGTICLMRPKIRLPTFDFCFYALGYIDRPFLSLILIVFLFIELVSENLIYNCSHRSYWEPAEELQRLACVTNEWLLHVLFVFTRFHDVRWHEHLNDVAILLAVVLKFVVHAGLQKRWARCNNLQGKAALITPRCAVEHAPCFDLPLLHKVLRRSCYYRNRFRTT